MPGIVALAHLLICRKLFLLRELRLHFGIPLFVAIVTPWYYEVERLNPGYLRYFFWEENFIRYLTSHFNRTEELVLFFLGARGWFSPLDSLDSKSAPRSVARAAQRYHALFASLGCVAVHVLFLLQRQAAALHPAHLSALGIAHGNKLERKITAGGVSRAWPLLLSCFCLCLLIAGFIFAASSPHVFPRRGTVRLHEASRSAARNCSAHRDRLGRRRVIRLDRTLENPGHDFCRIKLRSHLIHGFARLYFGRKLGQSDLRATWQPKCLLISSPTPR